MNKEKLAKAAIGGMAATTLGWFALPAAASAATAYTAQAQAAGTVINVFGTQLTGGTATVSVDSGAPSAKAEGVGTLTPGLVEDQKASAPPSETEPKACSQGGSLPGASPIGVTLGVVCSSASASVDAAGAPSASATGEIASLDVNVSGLLNQILSGGGDQLFSGIQQVLGQLNGTPLGTGSTACPDPSVSGSSAHASSTSSTPNPTSSLQTLVGTASVPGSPLNTLLGSLDLGSTPAAGSPGPLGNLLQGLCQTLTNIENLVKGANPPPTLTVDPGSASASITGSDSGTAKASALGATADIQVLPGVGCDASTLAACITDPSAYAAPLLEIQGAPARSTATFNGSTWTPSSESGLVSVDLNIPGDPQSISVSPGQSLDLLAGTPLETVIDLGSASANGDSANGATIDLAKGINGGILIDLGSTELSTDVTTAQIVSVPKQPQNTPAKAPSSPAPPGLTPTLVHTGAWWAGSLPYVAALLAAGAGLLAWPRFRRSARSVRSLLRAARR